MTATDRSIWLAMRCRMWEHHPGTEHEIDIDKMLDVAHRSGFLVETASGTPVGFAETCIREYANGCTEQPVPFLEGIWIEPGYRRHGAGSALLQHIETLLRAEGYREICSDADLENLISQAAHASWGFAETERVVYFRKGL
ncbi:GNAT family N-acetyltransferase [Nisaea sediminum]|uniref:GNAT family N-acetyltransferase n=1 Tax=Nisaea sediminum TaxID=2775867 RepID=UPI001867B11B|nr:GNAT family N-acetyltransferase [Nisaea sediminum]